MTIVGTTSLAAIRSGTELVKEKIKLDTDTDIPVELKLVNDRGNHWLWKPYNIMLLEDYKNALRQVGEKLYKINYKYNILFRKRK
ncbi:hypothetical protein DSM106972_016590 [Dulcicalothrix desertica PCC 7102]|uniref:Uncharacterized protein n=1 Tax=Dulcicalothrix desertica PCC 7102 TaxID=232991 RepID=A0A3S1CQH2_9CYAN|nr:hypothetical protein [Dulcicalothrix desertica]RUT08491.1 hypothetical protein DSM106972_016590 [Dulcicalothrix desertica PCC 7102]TWH40354.1 hypothetical protein CAL7102_09667 [Dulcicalothrix desertica PCC 7102]